MKKLIISLAAVLVSCAAFSQGAITFGNRVVASGVNAPVTFLGDLRPGSPLGGQRLADGPEFLAQFAVNGTPVGSPSPFRTGTLAGSVAAQVIDLGIPGGTSVSVVMLAWAAELGSSYAAAAAAGIGGIGQSDPITVVASAPPNTPAPLTGLQSFSIAPIIPEPGIASLGLLGAAVLFLRRKK